MSKCSGCKGCDTPLSEPIKTTPTNCGTPQKIDISKYLEPPPQQRADDTPLSSPCDCGNRNLGMMRSACLSCIKSWVQATCICKIEKEIERYSHVSKVTQQRLEQALKEKKGKMRLGELNKECEKCHK